MPKVSPLHNLKKIGINLIEPAESQESASFSPIEYTQSITSTSVQTLLAPDTVKSLLDTRAKQINQIQDFSQLVAFATTLQTDMGLISTALTAQHSGLFSTATGLPAEAAAKELLDRYSAEVSLNPDKKRMGK